MNVNMNVNELHKPVQELHKPVIKKIKKGQRVRGLKIIFGQEI